MKSRLLGFPVALAVLGASPGAEPVLAQTAHARITATYTLPDTQSPRP